MVQKKDIYMVTHEPNSLADYIPNTLFSLSGQTAVVVGVGGLGKMAAIGLAAAGAQLAVADIDENRAREVATEINESGGQAEAYVVDVTQKNPHGSPGTTPGTCGGDCLSRISCS